MMSPSERAAILSRLSQPEFLPKNELSLSFSLIKDDKELMLALVKRRGLALLHAGYELKCDRDVVMTAVESNGWALLFATRELKRDRDVVMAAVGCHGGVLAFAPDELRNNQEIVLAAVKSSSGALRHASAELQTNGVLISWDQMHSVRARGKRKLREALQRRAIFLFWQEQTHKSLCAPGGKGQKRDLELFQEDFVE